MIIRDIAASPYTRVIDQSVLCELLHPDAVPGTENLGCSIAHAIVPAGEETLPHRLHVSYELYYILSGIGVIHIDDESAEVRGGQIVLIPPGARQFIRNTGSSDLIFLAIVSPRWKREDEVLC